MKSAKTPSDGDGATHWKRRQTTENKDSHRAPARLSTSTDHAPNLIMAPVIPYPYWRDDGSACGVMAHHPHPQLDRGRRALLKPCQVASAASGRPSAGRLRITSTRSDHRSQAV